MQDIVIGADLGGTNIKAAAVDLSGHLLFRCDMPTQAAEGPEAVCDRIADAVRECLAGVENGPQRAAGVGVGSPGPLDLNEGVVLEAPNLPGWVNIPLRANMERRLDLPCVVENDGNAAALAEQWMGVGHGADSLVLFTLGTGIGGGIVLDGRVWHGMSGVAAEMGHMSIDPDGPRCNCGNKGCVEVYASAPAMVRRMREAIDGGAQTSLAARRDAITARDIHQAAVAGDGPALENMRATGFYLGVAVSNIMHILNPRVVAFSGGVTAAGDMLLGPIRDTVLERTIEACRQGVEVCFAALGENAGAIGAARSFMTLRG